jgi:hypothetical protein
MPSKAGSKITSDHEEIRRWAEARDAKPACVKGTGRSKDLGMLRLDFPGYSGEGSLQSVSWEEWFDKFDENNLALVYQETTASGEPSNFNKLVDRATASQGPSGSKSRQQRVRSANRSSSKRRANHKTSSRAKSASTRRPARSSRSSSTAPRKKGTARGRTRSR